MAQMEVESQELLHRLELIKMKRDQCQTEQEQERAQQQEGEKPKKEGVEEGNKGYRTDEEDGPMPPEDPQPTT